MNKKTAFTEEEIEEMLKEAAVSESIVKKVETKQKEEAKPQPKKKEAASETNYSYGISRSSDGKYEIVELSYNVSKGEAKIEKIVSRESSKPVAMMKADEMFRRLLMGGKRK